MKNAPADWAKATLLTRQTTNLSDVSCLSRINAAEQNCVLHSTLSAPLWVALTSDTASHAQAAKERSPQPPAVCVGTRQALPALSFVMQS